MYIIRKPMRKERLTYVSLVILGTHGVGSLLCLSFLVDCWVRSGNAVRVYCWKVKYYSRRKLFWKRPYMEWHKEKVMFKGAEWKTAKNTTEQNYVPLFSFVEKENVTATVHSRHRNFYIEQYTAGNTSYTVNSTQQPQYLLKLTVHSRHSAFYCSQYTADAAPSTATVHSRQSIVFS